MNYQKGKGENILKFLKKLRKEKGLTQGDLANMVQITQAHVSQIERGMATPSIQLLEKLAYVLEVNLYDFFKDERSA